MYVDGALEGDALALLEQHLAGCATCSARVGALRAERIALCAALDLEDAAPVPAFVVPTRNGSVAAATVLALVVAAGVSAFWQWLLAATPSGLHWLNPFSFGELLESGLNVTKFIVLEGRTMLSNMLDLVAALVVVALFAWGVMTFARRRAGTVMLLGLVVLGAGLPRTSDAVETRKSPNGQVTVAAGEVINDTLVAAGQTVVVDGDVNGDLFAFGQTVTVRGKVSGNLVTAAETTTVEGSVGGSIMTAGRAVQLVTAQVSGNLFGVGRDLEIGQGSNVAGNSLTIGDTAEINGSVGIDARGVGRNFRIAGKVAGDVDFRGERVDLLPTANVGGNLTTHTGDVDNVLIADGAVVGGSIDRQGVKRSQQRNRYARPGFYVGLVVSFAAAYLAGLALLWLFPALRAYPMSGAMDALRSAGIGFAAAVVLPVAAIIACATIIGLPVGIVTFILGLLGLYLSQPVIGQVIGRKLFRGETGEPNFAVTLLVGLAIVIVATNLPFIGGLLGLLVAITGLGVMLQLIYARVSRA